MSSAERVRVGVNGAAGKMGRRVVALAAQNDRYELAGAYERDGHPDLGKDAGFVSGCARTGVMIKTISALDRAIQVLIDFSTPDGSAACLLAAQSLGKPAVICTTALDAAHEKKLKTAAKTIPVVYAPNMSLGLNLMVYLTEVASKFLCPAYDAEIVEIHHRLKKDAPSGSARALADAIRRGSGAKLRDLHGREGLVGARQPGELGVLAVRGGDVVGDHTVHFLGLGERVELTHRASSRDTFAAGALRAAEWVLGVPPGVYGMRDVLGLPENR